MKINNKGYASTIIMFSILTLFLISMLMLVKTMNNSSSLNKKITEKVVDNINYDASGTMQDRLTALENTVLNLQNQLSNTEKNIITKIYPVGSIYMSTEDDTIEKVQSKFGGTWEKYSQGRTIIGEGTGTDSNGLVQTFTNGMTAGEYTHKLTNDEMPRHTHTSSVFGFQASAYITENNKTNLWIVGEEMVATTYGTSQISSVAGGSESHNNMEPYIVTYIYKRIK